MPSSFLIKSKRKIKNEDRSFNSSSNQQWSNCNHRFGQCSIILWTDCHWRFSPALWYSRNEPSMVHWWNSKESSSRMWGSVFLSYHGKRSLYCCFFAWLQRTIGKVSFDKFYQTLFDSIFKVLRNLWRCHKSTNQQVKATISMLVCIWWLLGQWKPSWLHERFSLWTWRWWNVSILSKWRKQCSHNRNWKWSFNRKSKSRWKHSFGFIKMFSQILVDHCFRSEMILMMQGQSWNISLQITIIKLE